MRLGKLTFRQKLMLFSLFLSITPVIIVGLFSAYLSTNSMQEEVNYNQTATLKQVQYHINSILKNLQIKSVSLASHTAIERAIKSGPSLDGLTDTLAMVEAIRKENNYSSLKFTTSLVYLQEKYVYSNATEMNESYYKRYVDMVKQNAPIYNSTFMVSDERNGERELLLFRPVPISTNYTDGILIIHVSIEELISVIETMPLENKTELFILDQHNNVVISNKRANIGTVWPETIADKEASTADAGITILQNYQLAGEDYFLSFQKSHFNDWTYVVMTPTAELMKRAEPIKKATLLMVIIILIVWSMISWQGSRRLYYPIANMVNKFTAIPHPEQQKQAHIDGVEVLDSYIDQMLATNTQLQQQIEEQAPYMQQNFVQQLLLGEMAEWEIEAGIEKYNLPLPHTWFMIGMVNVDDYANFMEKYKEKDRTLIYYAMRKVIEELLVEYRQVITNTAEFGKIAIIINLDEIDEQAMRKVHEIMNKVKMYIHQYTNFTVSIALSTPRKGYAHIHTSFEQSLALLKYRLMFGHDVVITDTMTNNSLQQIHQYVLEANKRIVSDLMDSKLEQAERHLQQLVESIPQYMNSAAAVMSAFSYLLGELEYQLYKVDGHLHDILQQDIYTKLHQMTTIVAIERWLIDDVFVAVHHYLQTKIITKQTKVVQQVLQYIDENYNEDISLQLVAEQFDVSASHLSRMIKEEIGQSFSDYLLQFRMNKAKDWLMYTDLPIKEIAANLRYTSVTNFTRAFKQYCGLPPGQYRQYGVSGEVTD